jgi:hypothetical protein
MQMLADKSGAIVGYIHQNILLLPEVKTAGIVLAHCVFTSSGTIKGKYFNDHIYDLEGLIVAKHVTAAPGIHNLPSRNQFVADAWQILQQVKNHNAPWVMPTQSWSAITFKDFLLQ